MKILVENHKVGYSSEVVSYKNRKFKISCSNGNSYSRVLVNIITDNGLALIADENDIPGCVYISYVSDDESRKANQLVNIGFAEKYVKMIYDN